MQIQGKNKMQYQRLNKMNNCKRNIFVNFCLYIFLRIFSLLIFGSVYPHLGIVFPRSLVSLTTRYKASTYRI